MPRKKATPVEEAAATTEIKETVKTAVKKTAAKKTTAKADADKKPAAKKTAAKKETADKKETAEKKAPAKKAAAKKTTAEKAEKKPAAKKAAAKKAVVKEEKPEVFKQTVKHYEDVINWKKGEAHAMDYLYIEINAGDLLTEVEAGVDNMENCCQGILNCMLEGDRFIVEPAEANKVSNTLTVRYYCDNLSPERRKYFDVQ